MNGGSIVAFDTTKNILSNVNLLKKNKLLPPESICLLNFLKNKGYNVNLNECSNKSCAEQIIEILENIK